MHIFSIKDQLKTAMDTIISSVSKNKKKQKDKCDKDICRNPNVSSLFAATLANALPKPSKELHEDQLVLIIMYHTNSLWH